MTPIRCRALCDPPTLSVSSFTQISPLPQPSFAASAGQGENGVAANPVPLTPAIARSRSRTCSTNDSSLIPRLDRQRVGRQALAIADERVRVSFVRERRGRRVRPPEHVIDVVALVRGRAPERRRRRFDGRQRLAAAGAGERQHAKPARALNSSIMASHAGRICVEPRPERGLPTRGELGHGHTLLLDPRVVAQVEDTRPVDR